MSIRSITLTPSAALEEVQKLEKKVQLPETLQKNQILDLAKRLLEDQMKNQGFSFWRAAVLSKELMTIKTSVARIFNIVSRTILGCNRDVLRSIFNSLSDLSLGILARVSKDMKELVTPQLNSRVLAKAHRFGYQGNNVCRAKSYLSEMEQEVLVWYSRIPRKYFVLKSDWVSTKLNVWETLKKLESMTSKELVFMLIDGDESTTGSSRYLGRFTEGSMPQKISLYLLQLTKKGIIRNTSNADTKTYATMAMLNGSLVQCWAVVELALLHGASVNEGWIKPPYYINEHKNCDRYHLDVENDVLFQKLFRCYDDYQEAFRKDTALFYATMAGDEEGVKLLKKYGATWGQHRSFPLDEAIKRGLTHVAIKNIHNGADVNYRGLRDKTPLMMAIERGILSVVRALVEHGARLTGNDNPLGFAVSCRKQSIVDYLRRVQLHLAIQAGSLREVKRLVEVKADLEADPGKQDSLTALQVAEMSGFPEIVDYLNTVKVADFVFL